MKNSLLFLEREKERGVVSVGTWTPPVPMYYENTLRII